MRLLTHHSSILNDDGDGNNSGGSGAKVGSEEKEEKIFVETEQKQESSTPSMPFLFNGEQMVKKRVVYPHSLKQHFCNGPVQDQETTVQESSTTTANSAANDATNNGDENSENRDGDDNRRVLIEFSAGAQEYNRRMMDRHHGTTAYGRIIGDFSMQNSKQLAIIPMALTHESSSAFMYHQMNPRSLQVGHTYQIPQETLIDDDSSVRLICPYIYPLLNHNVQSTESGNIRMQDLKNKYIKLLIPIQTFDSGVHQGKKIVRMAEIAARDISFNELYLEM